MDINKLRPIMDPSAFSSALGTVPPWTRIWGSPPMMDWWQAMGINGPYQLVTAASGTTTLTMAAQQDGPLGLVGGMDAMRWDRRAGVFDIDHYSVWTDGNAWYRTKPNRDVDGQRMYPPYHHDPEQWLIEASIPIILPLSGFTP